MQQNASWWCDVLNSCKKYLASCGTRQFVTVERHATCPCPEPCKSNPRRTSVSLKSIILLSPHIHSFVRSFLQVFQPTPCKVSSSSPWILHVPPYSSSLIRSPQPYIQTKVVLFLRLLEFNMSTPHKKWPHMSEIFWSWNYEVMDAV